MTRGGDGGAAGCAAIGAPAADAQAEPVVEECTVARKEGNGYVELDRYTDPLGQGEFYALLVLRPANGNAWNYDVMSRGQPDLADGHRRGRRQSRKPLDPGPGRRRGRPRRLSRSA